MTTPLTPSDLADLFPGQVVIVEPIREPVAPPHGAIVYTIDALTYIIQPLYTDADRALMRRQMRRIAEADGHKP